VASRLQDVILRGLAASKPAATAVAPGTLYFSSDSGILERSDGTTWQSYSGTGGVGSGAGGADFTNAGHPQGVVTGVGGQTCRDTTNGILYIKRSLASSMWGWYPVYPYGGIIEADCPMQFSWHASPPGNSVAGDNIALQGNGINFGFSGGVSQFAHLAADSYYTGFTTGNAAGNNARIYDAQFGSAPRFQWNLYNFDIAFKIRTDQTSIADQRLFVGVMTVAPNNADIVPGRFVGFRLSSVANAGQWDGVVCDNVTNNVKSSIAAAVFNTPYLLRIRYVSGTVYFSVNDGPEQSLTTNVPTDNTNPYIVISTYNVSGTPATARSFEISRMGCVIGT